ncbi:hypothetical protein EDF58_105121 [Novosphingobium sp. PhB57]|jgi:hypothetical protein|uniref:DUF4136 domain-containing protein n=2 Tax=Novosphingobium TaxID=165696 RepID=UPI00104D820C|nr:DUF4136 domain-containing protein [Novosphingobium sp. PhB57]TCU57283.1 hypothetical protein EDF58_105121 [Novosphingobium sp. PhB57]TDW67393.1 hypothetical protein EDF57_102279 [Novosphingobium sp. PhB55]
MKTLKTAIFATGMVATLLAAPALQARPGWGGGYGSGWGSGWGDRWGDPLMGGPVGAPMSSSRTKDSREGRVEVSRFVAQDPQAADLGHGVVSVQSDSGEGQWVPGAERAAYEAAIVDALVGAGYDTQHKEDNGGQVAELKISRQVLTPAEEKRNPVSGTAAMGVSNRGSAYGLAVNVDLTKPRTALIGTRLDTRIVDKASGKVLWEGYATIATREGDDNWPDYRIAGKLAAALFDGFPKADPVGVSAPQG